MTKYEVGFYFKGYITVEANSEQEAIELARNIQIPVDSYEYYELQPTVTKED